MIVIPNMVMIGGNSRHAGKTTLACSIISKLSVNAAVIGLKVSSVRPGESGMHGNHIAEDFSGYSITEETDRLSEKDTCSMLRAGAAPVFYIRAGEEFIEMAVARFLSRYNPGQPIVCESRSLRRFVKPGLFLMMMRMPAFGTGKDVAQYLVVADSVLHYSDDQSDIDRCAERISFADGIFYQVKSSN